MVTEGQVHKANCLFNEDPCPHDRVAIGQRVLGLALDWYEVACRDCGMFAYGLERPGGNYFRDGDENTATRVY